MAQSDQVMVGDIKWFSSDLKKMVNNKELSDIKFLIGPGRKAVYAHRFMLMARCEVFRAMFTDQSHKYNDPAVPFVLADLTPEIFLPLLEFIYSNCVTLNSKTAVDVLGTSIEYGLDGLKQLCVEYLTENLAVSNACDAMQAAVTYGQDHLREEALSYIEDNTVKVFKSKSFHEMSAEALVHVLKSNNLDIDEVNIITAVREWATVNSVVLSKPINQIASKVVQHLRLPLLMTAELTQLEKENKKDKLIPIDLISQAWKTHALKSPEANNPHTTKRRGTQDREHHSSIVYKAGQ